MATEYVRRFSARGAVAALAACVHVSASCRPPGLILYLPSFAELAADRELWKTIHLGAALASGPGCALLAASAANCGPPPELDRFDDDDRGWLAGPCPARRRAAGRAGSTPARS